MGVYIKNFEPQDGLYVIKDGVIRKYKGKGGTVRPYELVEVKEPHGRLIDADEIVKDLRHDVTVDQDVGILLLQGKLTRRGARRMIKAEWTNADALDLQQSCNQLATDVISRQAAIDALREEVEWEYDEKDEQWYYIEADMAIGAIERLPSAQLEERTKKRTETHACDLISRQAAIDAIVNTVSAVGLHDNSETARYGATFRQQEIITILKSLPSEDRPTGEWVFDTQIPIGKGAYSAGYRCSICGRDYFHVDGMNFCPNCGSYNGGEQSEND